jgi:Ca-activated chloride channel homolog
MLSVKNKYRFSIMPSMMAMVIATLCVFSVAGQSSYKHIKNGNKEFNKQNYAGAEVDYRKAVETKKNPLQGNYNLGNAYYKQGKYDQAIQQYGAASTLQRENAGELAKTLHNIGNSLLQSKKYEESIEAYKNSLKLNPGDNDTRYNLAYAKAMLKQQQQQNKDDKKDEKQNKDKQKQDQKKEDQKKEQEKQQQDQAKNEEKKQPKEQQARKDKISKEDAEKILQALNNDEKKTQKKLTQKEPTRIRIEKEW